jgi:hypothetical protein
MKVHFRNQFGGPWCPTKVPDAPVTAERDEVTCVRCRRHIAPRMSEDQRLAARRRGGQIAARQPGAMPKFVPFFN